MNPEITAESFCDMMVEPLLHVNRDDLAHLYAAGKNELYLHEHRKYGQASHTRLQSNSVWDAISEFRIERVGVCE
jgi:hypothetical protein